MADVKRLGLTGLGSCVIFGARTDPIGLTVGMLSYAHTHNV
jgi:hypothetical protein